MKPLVGDRLLGRVFFSDSAGTIYNTSIAEETIASYQDEAPFFQTFSDFSSSRRFLVHPTSFSSNLNLVCFLPESVYTAVLYNFLPLLIFLVFTVFLFFVSSNLLNKRWIIYPTQKIINAADALTKGNMNIQIQAQNECAEFLQVYSSFNHMVMELKNLKIDIYEEKLRRQYIKNQYLKLQMAPHFLINCLNTVYHLVEAGRPDLQKQMLQSLSSHLRYTLSPSESVPLSQELEQTRNYIELSLVRYPGSIRYAAEIDEEALSASAIPLLILNFIENTIKYEVDLTHITEIKLCIQKKVINSVDSIYLYIADTGNGFSAEFLERLQNYPNYLNDRRQKNIGIFNVIQRAEFYYGSEFCHFTFSNIPDSGAQIEITIPYLPFKE